MSKEIPMKLTITEKIIGLVLVIVGAIVTSYSFNLPAGDINVLSGIFVLIGFVIALAGILLLIVKGE
jgi:protein-S-isoprenylcysteine O-methyltransferase Ste14